MRWLPALAAIAAAAALAEPRTHVLRPSPEARMELVVSKTGLMRGKQHLFVFERFHGILRYDAQKPEASEIRLAIEARSAVCKDTWVNAKDLNKIQEFARNDMLAAERHPEVTFTSSAIKRLEGEKFEVQGALTIRGISKPSTLLVSLSSLPGGALRLEGRAQVRHGDYGLKPASAALGLVGTKDEMDFSFLLSAIPSPEK